MSEDTLMFGGTLLVRSAAEVERESPWLLPAGGGPDLTPSPWARDEDEADVEDEEEGEDDEDDDLDDEDDDLDDEDDDEVEDLDDELEVDLAVPDAAHPNSRG